MTTQREVEEFWHRNGEKRTICNLSDLRRLARRQEIDTLITTKEIQDTIKAFKNNTPGESHINKNILKNLPEIALGKLQDIFNHLLSMGYFPERFKTAILKLIPKANSNDRQVIDNDSTGFPQALALKSQ